MLYDEHGVARFAHEGGHYLPGCGDDWHFVHRRKPHARRLRVGDRVKLKTNNNHQKGGDDDDTGGNTGTVVEALRPPRSWAHCWPLGGGGGGGTPHSSGGGEEDDEDDDDEGEGGGEHQEKGVVGCGSGGHVPHQPNKHDEEPVHWRTNHQRRHDQRGFTSPAWHLELLPPRLKVKDGGSSGGAESADSGGDSGATSSALARGGDDPDELPWQV